MNNEDVFVLTAGLVGGVAYAIWFAALVRYSTRDRDKGDSEKTDISKTKSKA